VTERFVVLLEVENRTLGRVLAELD
jgi:hypothetical protein